jgi:hypothetical protein
MKTLLLLLVASCTSMLVAADDPPAIDADSVFALHESLTLLTPTPHRVSARVALLCVAPTPPDALDAERERAGPHADVAVNYYVSPAGAAAMASRDGPFPVGTILLKEKLASVDGEAAAVGGMVKRAPGFDPQNGDWEYFYAERAGDFAIGRLSNCAGCHARARKADFVFGRGR